MTLEASQPSPAIDIVFWVTAVSTIIAAIAVVQLKDLFRAALFLIVSFLGVAGMFILLRAEFLAAIQILIYVGAISILIIFAIMMTRDVDQGNPFNWLRAPAGIVAVLFGAVAIFVATATNWNLIDTAMADGSIGTSMNGGIINVFSDTIPTIARLLIGNFVLAFEIIGVLLLAAIIGALALVRE
jgi:NADH-quinone oxidoreductase subunit J